MAFEKGYDQYDSNEAVESDQMIEAEEQHVLLAKNVFREKRNRTPWGRIVLCVIFTNIITLTLALAVMALSQWRLKCAGDRVGEKSSWMADIDRSLHSYRFLPFSLTPSRYSLSAADVGDAVDDAWKDLGVYYNAILLPGHEAQAYSINPSAHHFVTPEEDPVGVPYAGYPVNVQVLHQLHCLNMLRQGLYHNVDYYRKDVGAIAWDDDQDKVIEAHLAHCVDELRQVIMCVADLDILGYMKPEVPGKQSMPDFARRKQCRNFESVRRWAEEHQWAAAFNTTPAWFREHASSGESG